MTPVKSNTSRGEGTLPNESSSTDSDASSDSEKEDEPENVAPIQGGTGQILTEPRGSGFVEEVPKAVPRPEPGRSYYSTPASMWTPGRVRDVCRQLILRDFETYDVHVEAKGDTLEERKANFAKDMSEHFRTSSWFANFHMAALATEFNVPFMNFHLCPHWTASKGGPKLYSYFRCYAGHAHIAVRVRWCWCTR